MIPTTPIHPVDWPQPVPLVDLLPAVDVNYRSFVQRWLKQGVTCAYVTRHPDAPADLSRVVLSLKPLSELCVSGAIIVGPSGEVYPPPAWSPEPPDSEGLWWLYGDDEYGCMGGHYTGSIPPEQSLHVVEILKIGGDHLVGVSRGRMINLNRFDRERRITGYVGVWQKVILPELPRGNVGILIGWFVTTVHDHPEQEGTVYFPADDPPKIGQHIRLPSDGSIWEIWTMNAAELKLIVKPL